MPEARSQRQAVVRIELRYDERDLEDTFDQPLVPSRERGRAGQPHAGQVAFSRHVRGPIALKNEAFSRAGFGLLVVIALYGATLAACVSTTRWVEQTLDVRKVLNEWRNSLAEAETNARAYSSGRAATSLEAYEAALVRERASEAAARKLLEDEASQATNVATTDHDALVVASDLASFIAL